MLSRKIFSSVLLIAAGVAVAAAGPASDGVEREFKECSVCPAMVGIPAGSFTMGSPASEPGRFDTEGPPHEVAIKAFALGKYNVTSAEFLKFLNQREMRLGLKIKIKSLESFDKSMVVSYGKRTLETLSHTVCDGLLVSEFTKF